MTTRQRLPRRVRPDYPRSQGGCGKPDRQRSAALWSRRRRTARVQLSTSQYPVKSGRVLILGTTHKTARRPLSLPIVRRICGRVY